jgi:hypothetical protein
MKVLIKLENSVNLNKGYNHPEVLEKAFKVRNSTGKEIGKVKSISGLTLSFPIEIEIDIQTCADNCVCKNKD